MWDFGEGEHLGAYATVVRWLPIPIYATDYIINFEKKELSELQANVSFRS